MEEDIVLFSIILNPETKFWDFISVDRGYEDFNEYDVKGGNQFLVMQNITNALLSTTGKTAAFKVEDDEPEVQVIQIENAVVLNKE